MVRGKSSNIIIVHVEEFETIRDVNVRDTHDDPGTDTDNRVYSTGRMDGNKLLVTTTFVGSNSPVQLLETFALSADHNRLEYTSTLVNPESDLAKRQMERFQVTTN